MSHVVAWLWTAPERIRDTSMAPTPKCDVYSFGIILQEVITETAPFGTGYLEPEGKSWRAACSILFYRWLSILP